MPLPTMSDFYRRTLASLLEQQVLARDHHVLVVCGAKTDRDVFHGLGFQRVTISNLDTRLRGDDFAPYAWSHQDAEALTFGDGTFDFVVAHSGLHHCYSPHRALLEMYRVARIGLVVLEPRDTLLVRLGVKLNFSQEYEVAAVAGNDMAFGGVRNTTVPNYVYRWTEHEVEKTLSTYDPLGRCRFRYFHAVHVPEARFQAMRSRLVVRAARLVVPVLRGLTALFPKQANCFAVAVEKPQLPRDLHPWLVLRDGKPTINADWVKARYGQFQHTPEP